MCPQGLHGLRRWWLWAPSWRAQWQSGQQAPSTSAQPFSNPTPAALLPSPRAQPRSPWQCHLPAQPPWRAPRQQGHLPPGDCGLPSLLGGNKPGRALRASRVALSFICTALSPIKHFCDQPQGRTGVLHTGASEQGSHRHGGKQDQREGAVLEGTGLVRAVFYPQQESSGDRHKPTVLPVPEHPSPPQCCPTAVQPPAVPAPFPQPPERQTARRGPCKEQGPSTPGNLAGLRPAAGSTSPCQPRPPGTHPGQNRPPQGQTSQLWHTQGLLLLKLHRGPPQMMMTACSMSASTYELSQGRPGCCRAPSSTRARAPSSVGSRRPAGLGWQNRISLTSPSMRRA